MRESNGEINDSVVEEVMEEKEIPVCSGRGLCVSCSGRSNTVLGLHHRDYCNTLQMGSCCYRLGEVDWTNEGEGGGRGGV